MMIFSKRVETSRERFLSGNQNLIPFQLDRVNRVCPGIIRGNFDGITGNTSSGKTSLAKKLYVFDAVEYAIEHQMNYHCIYFALEESEHEFDSTLMAHLLRKYYKVRYNIYDFDHLGRQMPEEDLSKIKALDEVFLEYKKRIKVIDNVYNTFGLYKEVRAFARERGSFYLGNVRMDHNVENGKWDNYIPNDPEEFIQIVTDHISEMHTEKGEATLADAMMNWSKRQRHSICKAFKYNCMQLHQQAADTEDLDHFKEKKLKPTLQGLGDNKRVGRLYLNCFGIFKPSRHGIDAYQGYQTNEFLRMMNIIKHRYGGVDAEWPLFFDGKCGHIKTMPRLEDHVNLAKAYDLANKLEKLDFS